ncbi:MAG: hypothetical protein ACRD88_22080, partial [Terriglobia bacterium]
MNKKSAGSLLYLLLCLFFHLFMLGLSSGSARNLLIQGGTLIDGTGRAPVPNVRILVEGNTIRRIWTGDAAPPSLPPDTLTV